MDEFLSLVKSPDVTFISSVSTVKLLRHTDRRPAAFLAELSVHGIHPTHLVLHCSHYFSTPLDSPPAFISSLVRLDIELNGTEVAVGVIVDYICRFPLLECLRIVGGPSIDHSIQPTSLELPPRLHTLHTDHPLFSDWIISLDPVPTQITTFGLVKISGFRNHRRWPEINRYLVSSAAENIHSLIFYEGDPGQLLQNADVFTRRPSLS